MSVRNNIFEILIQARRALQCTGEDAVKGPGFSNVDKMADARSETKSCKKQRGCGKKIHKRK